MHGGVDHVLRRRPVTVGDGAGSRRRNVLAHDVAQRDDRRADVPPIGQDLIGIDRHRAARSGDLICHRLRLDAGVGARQASAASTSSSARTCAAGEKHVDIVSVLNPDREPRPSSDRFAHRSKKTVSSSPWNLMSKV